MGAALGRRTFIKLVAAGGAAVSLPGCGARLGSGEPAWFFTRTERRTLEALAGTLVPEDVTVGAIGAHAVEYIDRFLAAFDNPTPSIYRGGPFSGRAPYPDPETGGPTDRYPRNAFSDLLPLSRLQEASFRILLHGSEAVPGATLNVPAVPAWPGLRTLYRQGLGALRAAARDRVGGFEALDADERLAAFDAGDPAFRSAVLTHLAEGMFCAPEYGGNPGGIAWRDYHYDGDSQPLGYSLYDRRTHTLRDRVDRPNQSRDPDLPGDGLDPGVVEQLTAMMQAVGGKRFF